MSTFKDAAEVYEYLGKMFEIAVNDPQFVAATKGGDLVVRITQTDPASTILVSRAGGAKRMDLSPPERFVDIDVPEPSHRSLVEQRSLDRCATAFESLCEPPRREGALERLETQPLFEVRLQLGCLEQLPGAEAANVAICDVRSVV